MKICLVRPGYMSAWEPLGLGYIASYVSDQYPLAEIEFECYDGFFDDRATIVENCQDADIIGISLTTPQLKEARYLAGMIKQLNPSGRIVFGGYHPSVEPAKTADLPEVDQVVVGEGEIAFSWIVGNMLTNEPLRQPILNSQYHSDLELYPFPDRHIIQQKRYVEYTQQVDGERIAAVQSTRGCPFRCKFCANYRVHGWKVRQRDPVSVLNEMAVVQDWWDIDFIKFCDAEINATHVWLQDFCEKKAASPLDIPWGANIHAARITPEILALMADANCREIWVGVESGSQDLLNSMRKNVTVKRIKEVFREAKKVGIKRRAYFMVGFPTETQVDFNYTMNLAFELDADLYGMTILAPYPGTYYYGEFMEQLNLEEVDWSEVDEYRNSVWSTTHFSNAQLKELQNEFNDAFKDRLAGGPKMRFQK